MLSTTEFIDNGVRYYVYDNQYVTIGNELNSPQFINPTAAVSSSSVVGDLIIPERFNDLPIVNLSKGAFARCPKIKKVIILANIEIIPLRCFADCLNLLYIEIPSSVKSIGPDAIQYYNLSQPNQSTIHSIVVFRSGSMLTSIAGYNFAYVAKVTLIFESPVIIKENSFRFMHTNKVLLFCNKPMKLGSIQSVIIDQSTINCNCSIIFSMKYNILLYVFIII